MVQARDDFVRLLIAGAAFKPECRLADARKHDFKRQERGEEPDGNIRADERAIGIDLETESFQTGESEDDSIEVRIIHELMKPGAHIAADRDGFQIGPNGKKLGLSAGAAGGDRGAVSEIFYPRISRVTMLAVGGRRGASINQNIPDILALAHPGKIKAIGKFGGEILQTVDGELGLTVQHRDFEFFREKTFWDRSVVGSG